MKITMTLRGGGDESWQKEYTEEKMKKLDKYIDTIAEAQVVLQVSKFRNTADINLTANGLNINSQEEAKDMRLAIDNAIDKLERQIKKHKQKIRGHKASDKLEQLVEKDAEIEEGEELSAPRIIETRKLLLTPLSLEDAILQIEETNSLFVVYRDTYTENVHIIYRREDDSLAVIETNG